jgi:hypothetical protein
VFYAALPFTNPRHLFHVARMRFSHTEFKVVLGKVDNE